VVVVLLATLAVPRLRGGVAPTVAVAALIGLPLGALGRGLWTAFEVTGAAPLAAAAVVIAATTAVAASVAARVPVHGALAGLAIALAAAASAGRAGWILSIASAEPTLRGYRIEALGVYPSVGAIVAAGAGLALTLILAVCTTARPGTLRRCAGPPR
jgi:hypothetical protein